MTSRCATPTSTPASIAWLASSSRRASSTASGCCGSGRTPSACSSCCWRALGLGRCSAPPTGARARQSCAFVIDDLTPRIVVWQEEEIGDAVREARDRRPPTSPLDPPRHRRRGWVRGRPRHRRATRRARRRPGQRPAGDVHRGVRRRPEGGRAVAHRVARPGPHHRPDAGRQRRVGVPELGPLFHIATFATTLATFHHGGTNVFMRRADAEELCRLIEAERCTGAFLMRPTIDQIREVNADGRYDLSSLRTARIRSAYRNGMIYRRQPVGARPGGYGQTEVVGLTTLRGLGRESTGAAGRPAPASTVRIVDPDGREVAPGEVGEIVVRGPTVMNGYCDRDDLNAATWARRMAPHQRPRPARGRRLAHVRRAEDPDDQVGGREHLPGRGRGLPPSAPGGARRVRDRRARPTWVQSVKAVVVLRNRK